MLDLILCHPSYLRRHHNPFPNYPKYFKHKCIYKKSSSPLRISIWVRISGQLSRSRPIKMTPLGSIRVTWGHNLRRKVEKGQISIFMKKAFQKITLEVVKKLHGQQSSNTFMRSFINPICCQNPICWQRKTPRGKICHQNPVF